MSNKEIYELLKKAVNICKRASDEDGYGFDYIVFPLERNDIDIKTIDGYDETKDYATAFRALYWWVQYKSWEVIDIRDGSTNLVAGMYHSIISTHYKKFDRADFLKNSTDVDIAEILKQYNLN